MNTIRKQADLAVVFSAVQVKWQDNALKLATTGGPKFLAIHQTPLITINTIHSLRNTDRICAPPSHHTL
jgi:hypothetical protein